MRSRVVLLLLVGIGWTAGFSAVESLAVELPAKKLAKLTPEKRPAFLTAYETYAAARQEWSRQQSSVTNTPALLLAIAGVEKAEAWEQKANELFAVVADLDRALGSRGDESSARYGEWKALITSLATAEVFHELGDNPAAHEMVGEFALVVMSHLVQSATASPPPHWELVKDLLPPEGTEWTERLAADCWLKWMERINEQCLKDLARLDPQVAAPDNLRQALRLKQRALTAMEVYGPYLRKHMPPEYEAARNRMVAAHQSLGELWPEWEQILQEGPFSPAPIDPRAEPLPAERPFSWFLIVNFVVVAVGAAAVFLITRRSANSGRGGAV